MEARRSILLGQSLSSSKAGTGTKIAVLFLGPLTWRGWLAGWSFAMLSANFRAHEKDVGDAEANGHQAEQGGNVGPDKIEALAQLQRRW